MNSSIFKLYFSSTETN